MATSKLAKLKQQAIDDDPGKVYSLDGVSDVYHAESEVPTPVLASDVDQTQPVLLTEEGLDPRIQTLFEEESQRFAPSNFKPPASPNGTRFKGLIARSADSYVGNALYGRGRDDPFQTTDPTRSSCLSSIMNSVYESIDASVRQTPL